MKKNIAIILICIAILFIALLFSFRQNIFGTKPFRDLTADEIDSATVMLSPPDKEYAVPADRYKELVSILNRLVIYEEDATLYAGQAVIFTITKTDGTSFSVIAYNPQLHIDGMSYRTKYEPCEELNRFGNSLQ